MWLAQPLLRRKLIRRSQQEPGYGQAIDERFGHYVQAVPSHDSPTVWIHAVSLGETRAAAVLIAALRTQWPTMRLLLTHGTATGRAEGLKLLQTGDLQAWQPWDTPGAVKRFLTHFQPTFGLLIETEVWPNLSTICQQRGTPLVLVNARLSDKSLKHALKLAWLARPAFAALSAVWAQTPLDAERLKQLKAPVLGVLGNLKFDAAPDAGQIDQGRQWRAHLTKPVLMLASSREGEELALLQILKAFRPLTPDQKAQAATNSEANQVQWLIVPRHPQRFEAVAALIQAQGFSVSRRSSWSASGPALSMATTPTVWLGDSLGEMALYYSLVDLTLLGGSFEPLGGQNLIEAAACSCPVVMGPHTFNFAQAAEQAQACGAALRADSLAQAVALASALAFDQPGLKTAQQAAIQFASTHQGVATRLAGALTVYWHPHDRA
jgi:3-deoxy-D-manno-octulosonic-acid transferase